MPRSGTERERSEKMRNNKNSYLLNPFPSPYPNYFAGFNCVLRGGGGEGREGAIKSVKLIALSTTLKLLQERKENAKVHVLLGALSVGGNTGHLCMLD